MIVLTKNRRRKITHETKKKKKISKDEKISNFIDVFGTQIIVVLVLLSIFLICAIGLAGDKIFNHGNSILADDGKFFTINYFFDGLVYIAGIMMILAIVALLETIIVTKTSKILFLRKINNNPVTDEELEALNFNTAKEYLQYIAEKINITTSVLPFESEFIVCDYSKRVILKVLKICEKKVNVDLKYELTSGSITLYQTSKKEKSEVYESVSIDD